MNQKTMAVNVGLMNQQSPIKPYNLNKYDSSVPV